MATNLTKTELATLLAEACKQRDEIYKFGAVNTPNFLDQLNVITEDNKAGTQVNAVSNGLNAQRNNLRGLLDNSSSYILPILREFARVGYSVNVTGLNDQQVIELLRDAMNAASETIASRDLTYGTIVAGGSNAGSGTVLRTTKDRHDNNLEAGDVGAVKIEVIQDKNNLNIRPGREIARIYGSGTNKVDSVELNDSTNQANQIRFVRAEDSILINPSFTQIDNNITNTEQTGWRLSDVNNFTKVVRNSGNPTGDIFRYDPGTETTINPSGASLQFDDNAEIAQYIARTNRSIRRDVPYFFVVRWMRKNSADGTLEIKLGSQTESVAVNTGTNDVWNNLILGNGSTNKGWYDVFFEDWEDTTVSPTIRLGTQIKIELTSRTTGQIIIDDVILAPGELFNGLYYLPISDQSNEDVLIKDNWTYTDSYTGATYAGVIQETVRSITGQFLPHTTGAETFPDA